MWNLPKGNDFLFGTSLHKLQEMYKHETKAKPKLRLLAAIHRKKGKSMDEIAYHLDVPRNTVHGWLRNFQLRGVGAKDSIKQIGRPAQLSLVQRRRLIKELERGPPHNPSGLWSTKEVRGLISKKYKRQFVKQHVWRMLVSLGFSMQRPRKRHYQHPNDEEIAQFKKKLDEKQSTTVRKDLLWAHRMKQLSG